MYFCFKTKLLVLIYINMIPMTKSLSHSKYGMFDYQSRFENFNDTLIWPMFFKLLFKYVITERVIYTMVLS